MSEPRIHDFTKAVWGHALHMIEMHDLEIRPSWWRRLLGVKPSSIRYLSCLGHGQNIVEGDILLVAMQSGRAARFLIRELCWLGNPNDMFRVDRADFVGYEEID